MNIAVFDTETIGLEKCFCYNVGVVIANTESGEILARQEWIVEQIWHNTPLFETAYYATKKPIYVKRMRARQAKMDKWGYIMRDMRRLFQEYEVCAAYAYNSPFDEKVFNFNCDWFKTQNPFDEIPTFDIRGYVHKGLCWTQDFQNFCEVNQRFTETGNYSTTAETVYQYISNEEDFEEEHTALADSVIEWEILKYCVNNGCEWNANYKVYRSIVRKTERELTVITREGETHNFKYEKMTFSKAKSKITLK